MALINCPECGEKVSDHAKYCVHCGFPLTKKDVCLINGVEYNLSEFKTRILNSNIADEEIKNQIAFELSMNTMAVNKFDAYKIIEIINETGEVPISFDVSPNETLFKYNSQIRCPKCSSTQIVTGQRGYNVVWGFIGSSKTTNRCANCGHSWQPKR